MSINIEMAMSRRGYKKISKEEFDAVIKEHALWLNDKAQGKRAELNDYFVDDIDIGGTDLSYADLSGTSFIKTKLVGVNLTGAKMDGSVFENVDLTDAILDDSNCQNAHICHSKLIRIHAKRANFINCLMWDNDFTEAVLTTSRFIKAQLCDGRFTGADLSYCDLLCADIDYAHFDKANLECANLKWTYNSYWAIFKEANMEDIILEGSPIKDEAVEGAKNLFIPMVLPEEGSFIAWKKCRDGRIIKLMVPESAQRTGGQRNTCRASEVLILDIFDGENCCEEAVSIIGANIVYHKGELVKDKEEFDGSLLHDGTGIHFYITRAEAERAVYENDDKEEDDVEDDKEDGN